MNRRILALGAALSACMLAPAGAQTSTTGPTSSASGMTTGSITLRGATRLLTVDDLGNMNLVDPDGRGIGAIRGVVESNADNMQFVLVQYGGFWGFGAKAIAVPLDNLAVLGSRITLHDMDPAELDEVSEFKNDSNAYRELEADQHVSVRQL